MLFKTLVSLTVALVILSSCKPAQQSPEEIVHDFITFLSDGECEEAFGISTDESKEIVQATIDSGCIPFETVVDSVICKIDGANAECRGYENRGGTPVAFNYSLELINEEWKIAPNKKIDLNDIE